jgi:AAHS family 4-hydroxybenzoate transporter-like MFS transporter
MAGAPEIQVSRLLDERGLGAFQIRLLFWAILLSLIDGYDIAAIAFAAPHLVASWGIPRSALGPVLSASNIGVLFGSAIFGWVGDRYGRKPALIGAIGLSMSGLPTRGAGHLRVRERADRIRTAISRP